MRTGNGWRDKTAKSICLVSKLVEQTSCPTQFRFQVVITDLLIALFSNADLSTRVGGLLWYLSYPRTGSHVRKRKKKTTSNQIEEKLELEFPMCSRWSTPPIAFSLRDPYEKYTWSVRAVTWDCRRVRSRTSVSHVLEFPSMPRAKSNPRAQS